MAISAQQSPVASFRTRTAFSREIYKSSALQDIVFAVSHPRLKANEQNFWFC
jgi:hypothetical protein